MFFKICSFLWWKIKSWLLTWSLKKIFHCKKIFSSEKKETLDKGLEKSKTSFFTKLNKAVAGKSKVDDDVLDNLEIHDEDVKSLIAKCESVDEEAEKLQAKKMDATLYTLTVVSAVFLPAQFLTGKCRFSV